MSGQIPAIVLGGTGYVSGELLRLIMGHPHFSLAGVMSDSAPGELAGKSFPHLAVALGNTAFKSQADIAALIASQPASAVFCAAPHGAAAALIDSLLKSAEAAGTRPRVVDISADFRFATAAAYEAVYKHPHGAPQRLAQFTCAVPEHLKAASTPHVGHPGCFSTAILLASVPLLASGWTDTTLFVSGITGSTGSGRKPAEGTHHPLRHSDLYSYGALGHRHTPEITALAKAATGTDPEYSFVPHSGPFARGIHATVQARLRSPRDAAAVVGMLREFYAGAPFVRVLDSAPRVKDIVATNYAHLSAAANGRTVAVMSAVDNLNKGAAGGAVQWMNRLFGLPETAGLTAPAAGWT
ncbi:MAG TPA: N-acetyl-gamma-glutamyl-phosphate reductase [Steroidobacteraceae bacterium]|jgi:N-acetyl-gamma-glutamyl-phosphate reductase common form|nr:N-acetyl-gamma-glutamyl-phosphate reductase [Steroidobacteraceae bacterium]